MPVFDAGISALRVALLVALAVALLGATAVHADGASAASPSNGATGGKRTAQGIAWRRCGVGVDCARVRVPLDWYRTAVVGRTGARASFAGPTISLAVIRRRASGPGRRIGSLFLNPGGPGVSGVDTVRDPTTGAILNRLAEGRFDIVSWDTRGSGASAPVTYLADRRSQTTFWGDLATPTTRAGALRYVPKSVAYARRCGARSGRLLSHISTADSIRDLDYLRALVGERRLTYLGWSYGTFLGQTYANVFPGRVRAMVLDGVVDAVRYVRGRESSLEMIGSSTDDVFDQFLALCQRAGPSRCALARHRSVRARVNDLLARIRRASIPASSARPPGRLTYGDLLTAMFPQVRNPGGWPEFAEALEAAAGGDGSALETQARQLPPAVGGAPAAVGIGCADSPARSPIRAWPAFIGRFTRLSFISGPLLGWWLWAPCASWPTDSARRYTGPWNASTRSPVLVVGTRHDPNTAYANAVVTARRLGNAVLLTHDGYGHISLTDPSVCAKRAIGRYLVTLATPRRGTVCPSDRQPFDPDFGQPVG